MLVKLVLSGGRKFTYKITSKEMNTGGIRILNVFAPMPHTLKQKRKLADFLIPFKGRIIYPEGFNVYGFPKALISYEDYCRKRIVDFLDICKNQTPDIAVIIPRGRIKDEFYLDLSEYVGKIIIKESAVNKGLQNKLLEYSGTIIEFNINFNQKGTGILELDIPV